MLEQSECRMCLKDIVHWLFGYPRQLISTHALYVYINHKRRGSLVHKNTLSVFNTGCDLLNWPAIFRARINQYHLWLYFITPVGSVGRGPAIYRQFT